MFKVGQKVTLAEKSAPRHPVSIEASKKVSKYDGVVRGKIYIVRGVKYCCNCGEQQIDIGSTLPPEFSSNTLIACSNCGKAYSSENIWWCRSADFRAVQYDNISSEIARKIKQTVETSDQHIKEIPIKTEINN